MMNREEPPPPSFEYWREDDVPVVHIAGTCEGTERARSGFGTDWGPLNTGQNIGGTALGQQTTLRAHLSALKKALEIGLSTRVNARCLIVRHKSPQLADELRKWEDTSAAEEHTFQNCDLLQLIDRYRASFENVWIEEAEPGELAFFKTVTEQARRFAGTHSTSGRPLDDGVLWVKGVRVVHIFGTVTKSMVPRAGYAVYWGRGDARNESGRVEGEQCHRRGQVMAVWAALEQAIASEVDQLIIKSKCSRIHTLINRQTNRRLVDRDIERHSDLIQKIEKLRPHFTILYHHMVSNNELGKGQEKAAKLARTGSMVIRSEVTTCAVELPCGSIRYGVFYRRDDPRNESGRVNGRQSLLHGNIVALRKALENAIASGVKFLHIRTISPDVFYFATTGITTWEKFEWTVGDQETWVHAEIGRAVVKLMKEVKVNVTLCTEREVCDAARSVAFTRHVEKHVTVQTAGALFMNSCRHTQDAGYGVYWKKDDERNEEGTVDGDQNHLRAGFKAIERALEIAVQKRIARLLIRIPNEYVYKTVAENLWKRKEWWRDEHGRKDPFEDVLKEIDRLQDQLMSVEYERHKCDGANFLANWVTRKGITGLFDDVSTSSF